MNIYYQGVRYHYFNKREHEFIIKMIFQTEYFSKYKCKSQYPKKAIWRYKHS